MDDDAVPRDLVRHELRHQTDLGRDVTAITVHFERLCASVPANGREYLELLAELEAAGPPDGSTPGESSTIEELDAVLEPSIPAAVDWDALPDRVHGSWHGRVVGNMLGKPVENGKQWTLEYLTDYLRGVDAIPLSDYVPVHAEEAERWGFLANWPETTRGRVQGSSRDDDIDYTILNLHVLETRGDSFTTADVASAWLELLPFHQTYTAERAVYRSLVLGVDPSDTGGRANPYREWIGALIRADVFGMTNPGDPRAAARMAWRDAFLSHHSSGLYAAMWAAALVSTAFTARTVEEIVTESLRHVPAGSRLRIEVETLLGQWREGRSWDEAVTALHARHAGRNWVHALNNAGVITAGLLWSEGDFTTGIGLTVRGALDTDSNGATVGAVLGAFVGRDAIPDHWTRPIDDRIRSAIPGFDGGSIDDLARRTLRLVHGFPDHEGTGEKQT